MKIILATGIYPPKIGGPATYCRALAEELANKNEVIVVTYGVKGQVLRGKGWNVESVSKSIPIIRWFRYAKKLKEVGSDADVIYCFSSISCGIPLVLAGLKKPKKILRLGGDFFWERYTDRGGRLSLRSWYLSRNFWIRFQRAIMALILNSFDHIVFSTYFQSDIYKTAYKKLPTHSIIENALQFDGPFTEKRPPHSPFKLLFMGRFVKFKNIEMLIAAIVHIDDVLLTIVGSGPLDDRLRKLVEDFGVHSRVMFVGPVQGKEKQDIFEGHDLLVIPSLTDISPNVALEAKAAGLEVLITHENGLGQLANHMFFHPMNSVDEITEGIQKARRDSKPNLDSAVITHPWPEVASETLSLFATLVQ